MPDILDRAKAFVKGLSPMQWWMTEAYGLTGLPEVVKDLITEVEQIRTQRDELTAALTKEKVSCDQLLEANNEIHNKMIAATQMSIERGRRILELEAELADLRVPDAVAPYEDK